MDAVQRLALAAARLEDLCGAHFRMGNMPHITHARLTRNEWALMPVEVNWEGGMNSLLYVAVALSVGAIAVTVYAFFSAPEGFEDEEGFHAIGKRADSKTSMHTAEDSPDAGVQPRFYSH